MNRFLAELEPAERAHIEAQTERVTDRLTAWALPYGVMDARRIHTLALTAAATSPWLPAAALCETAAIPLWIFAVDDAFDEGGFPEPTWRSRVRRFVQAASGEPLSAEAQRDPYAAALGDIAARLRRWPAYTGIAADWLASCSRMLAGMVFECRISATRTPPAVRLSEYMARGIYSVGVPMHFAGLWIIAGSRETARRLPILRGLAREAGRALRLANDLRSYQREQEEGTVNAVSILEAHGRTRADARAEIARRLESCRTRLTQRLQQISSGPEIDVIRRVTAFSLAFYAEHDYHTVPRERIHRL